MKKSTKAALFSALIFPGAGLWWLKLYWRAVIFIFPAGGAVWYLFTRLQSVANSISQQMSNGKIHVDLLNIEQAATQITLAAQKIIEEQHYHLDFAQWVFIASWLCSIASSYFAGKQQEISTTLPN